jgi:predicted nucleic acid-binding protein
MNMMKPKIYVETTIPSFYHEDRIDVAAVARREWTRQWWTDKRQNYDLLTSIAVLNELESGDYPKKENCLNLLNDLLLVTVEPEIIDIVQVYIKHKVMPRDPVGDALHLALASYHKCDFLLTWNCKNLANANKFGHIRQINGLLGLYTPSIVTPLELLEDEKDERYD